MSINIESCEFTYSNCDHKIWVTRTVVRGAIGEITFSIADDTQNLHVTILESDIPGKPFDMAELPRNTFGWNDYLLENVNGDLACAHMTVAVACYLGFAATCCGGFLFIDEMPPEPFTTKEGDATA